MSERIVVWYSHGAASACAGKVAIDTNNASNNPKELIIVNIHLEDEHPDGQRFLKDCEEWWGQKAISIRDTKYGASVDKVIEKTKYMSGIYGARCTKELKKQVRLDFQRDDDIHVFGLTVGEENRIDQILDTEPDLDIWTPLIDKGLSKEFCFEWLSVSGIELPEMYKLGYHNNNCIGCLKANSAGYWNKIRKDFPEVFEKRSKQEQLCNVSLVMFQTNVYFNEHREEVIRDFNEFNRNLKFNGSGDSPLNKGKPNDAIVVPLELVHRHGVEYDDKHLVIKGSFRKLNYDGVLFNTSEFIEKHSDLLLEMLTSMDYIKVFNTRLRIPLRYLPETAGSVKDLDIGSCGFFCEIK